MHAFPEHVSASLGETTNERKKQGTNVVSFDMEKLARTTLSMSTEPTAPATHILPRFIGDGMAALARQLHGLLKVPRVRQPIQRVPPLDQLRPVDDRRT
jgi:hypothetical protein